jgi:membrane protein YqaA with SNARE-associated domain
MTKVGITAATTTVGAVAANVPGAIVGAVAGDLAGEIIVEPILTIYEHKRKTGHIVERKVDSIWTLLARMSEVAGWVLGAFLIIPLVLPLLIGWIIPAPGSRKK